MDIKDFIAGRWETGYQYKYFSPSLINHEFYWTESRLNHLLERSAFRGFWDFTNNVKEHHARVIETKTK